MWITIAILYILCGRSCDIFHLSGHRFATPRLPVVTLRTPNKKITNDSTTKGTATQLKYLLTQHWKQLFVHSPIPIEYTEPWVIYPHCKPRSIFQKATLPSVTPPFSQCRCTEVTPDKQPKPLLIIKRVGLQTRRRSTRGFHLWSLKTAHGRTK